VTVLTTRALNRAVLDRQLLLRRADMSAEAVIEHLVGLQAQAPFPPYTGLWTRLAGFQPDELGRMLTERTAVRIALMRGTVHLVTAADCLTLRPVLQPVLDRFVNTSYRRQLAGLDLAAVAKLGRQLVEEKPRSTAELARLLGERWPDHDRQALLNLVRSALPLVQTPPRAVWGKAGQTVVTTAEAWLDRPLAEATSPDPVVLRYLAAFGPASVADVQKWSGLTRLGEVVARLGPRLRAFAHEDGVTRYDLPDAPRPDPDTPAPVRFLPDFDNLIIGYADGSHVIAGAHRPTVYTVNGIIRATVLVDGFAAAVWRIVKVKRVATLEIEPFGRLSKRETSAVEAEGARLLGFAASGAERHEVRIR
jgi:Winged helix DNA-binding domain